MRNFRPTAGDHRLTKIEGKWKVRVQWIGNPVPSIHAFPSETSMTLFVDDLVLDSISSILIFRGD